jgi:hypothetical protein
MLDMALTSVIGGRLTHPATWAARPVHAIKVVVLHVAPGHKDCVASEAAPSSRTANLPSDLSRGFRHGTCVIAHRTQRAAAKCRRWY